MNYAESLTGLRHLQKKLSKKFNLKIIQVYAPISARTDKELESFYEEETQAFDHRKTQQTIIMGDFNAKIGEGTEFFLMTTEWLEQYSFSTQKSNSTTNSQNPP